MLKLFAYKTSGSPTWRDKRTIINAIFLTIRGPCLEIQISHGSSHLTCDIRWFAAADFDFAHECIIQKTRVHGRIIIRTLFKVYLLTFLEFSYTRKKNLMLSLRYFI